MLLLSSPGCYFKYTGRKRQRGMVAHWVYCLTSYLTPCINTPLLPLPQRTEEGPDGQSSSRGEGSLHGPGPDPLHSPGQPQNLQADRQEDEPFCQPDFLLSSLPFNGLKGLQLETGLCSSPGSGLKGTGLRWATPLLGQALLFGLPLSELGSGLVVSLLLERRCSCLGSYYTYCFTRVNRRHQSTWTSCEKDYLAASQ